MMILGWRGCFSLAMIAVGLLSSHDVQAHTLTQARVVHLLITETRAECYINLLLPKGGKSAFWQRVFDRNRDQRLDPKEQLALGRFLATRYLKNFSATLYRSCQPTTSTTRRPTTRRAKPRPAGATPRACFSMRLTWQLREVQNSRLRGNPLRKSYAWDYRFSANIRSATPGEYRLSLHFPLLFTKEQIPVALVPLGKQQLVATSSSYLLRRKGKKRAICRIEQKRPRCEFAWRVGGSR